MRLSVIVPLYNCLPLTQAMLASLRASLPSDLEHEIILVDDGSTDGTREWLEEVSSSFQIVRHESNQGYAAANNNGAALATGDYLALLNNDLLLPRGWLEPMFAAFRSLGPRAGIVGNVQRDVQTGATDHAGIFINHKGKPEHDRRRVSALSRLLAPVRQVEAVTGACLLLPRALWEELGGFDESYVNGCEDIDLCFRASAAGRIIAVALRSRIRHHISTAPGRKVRDEANTYLLTQRWQETLALLGQSDWCRHHYETYLPEPRDYPDPDLARAVFLYVHGLGFSPPAGAAAGMRAAIDLELGRWAAMFSRP